MSEQGWTDWTNSELISGPSYFFVEDSNCSYGVWYKVFSHFSEFIVFEHCNEECVPAVGEDEWEFTGTVKWDGCSDWNFNGSFHACTLDGLASLAKIMQKCWLINQEQCPSAEK